MLIVMGISRLLEQRRPPAKVRPGASPSRAAYAVGLLHGLAGSGALVLLVMSEIRDPWVSVVYFAVFGLGSILGMFIVAGLRSVPFTQRMKISRVVKNGCGYAFFAAVHWVRRVDDLWERAMVSQASFAHQPHPLTPSPK